MDRSVQNSVAGGGIVTTDLPPTANPVIRTLKLLVRFAPTGQKYFKRSIFLRKRYCGLEEVPALDGLESVWAGAKEFAYIDAHPEATSTGAYSRRAARGDWCLCLKCDDEIIGYRWATQHSGCLFCGFGAGYELLFFPLRPDQVFVYDSYVYSAHRGKGYSKLIRDSLHAALQRRGVRESYGLVEPENIRSLKLVINSGYEPLCIAYGVRIRNWSKMILGPSPDAVLARWTEGFKIREGIA
jgi:GNAT superfamily N-acetyltransferase